MSVFEITTEHTMEAGLPVAERSQSGTSVKWRGEGILACCPRRELALLAATTDPQGCGRVLGQVL